MKTKHDRIENAFRELSEVMAGPLTKHEIEAIKTFCRCMPRIYVLFEVLACLDIAYHPRQNRAAASTRQDLRELAKDSAEWVRENADQPRHNPKRCPKCGMNHTANVSCGGWSFD